MEFALKTITIAVITAAFAGTLATSALADRVDEARTELHNAMAENYAAREIAKQCKSLSVRQSQIIAGATATRDRLLAEGYSRQELQKAALSTPVKSAKAAGQTMALNLGAVAGEKATYCVVGLAQIEAGTTIGSYLKAR